MKRRFLVPFAVAACLLGVMLVIVVGHVRSVIYDWSDATYRMTDGAWTLTVYPNPDGEAPNADRSARINEQLRELVAGADTVIVLDALDADGPRVGLYDTASRFSAAAMTEGRGFDPDDFRSEDTTAIVRNDSYLVGREKRYIPNDVTVIGYYDPASLPFVNEYVYTLFSQENVHGTYYIDASDSSLARQFVNVLEQGGYVVEDQQLDPNAWSILQGEPLTYAYGTSLLLVYGSVLLLSSNWIAWNQRRYRIEHLYGARPTTFTMRTLRLVTPVAALGTTVGTVVGILALRALGTLSVPPNPVDALSIVVGNGITLPAMFAVVVIAQTSRWGRS